MTYEELMKLHGQHETIINDEIIAQRRLVSWAIKDNLEKLVGKKHDIPLWGTVTIAAFEESHCGVIVYFHDEVGRGGHKLILVHEMKELMK